MAYNTKIEWAEASWSPIIGCSKVSPGCTNCYAERMANRIVGMEYKQIYSGIPTTKIPTKYNYVMGSGKWNGKTFFVESALEKPTKWKKPRTIFVCSMGDLFHESVPFEWIDKVVDVMVECRRHTFLLLTKRPEVLKAYSEYNMSEAIPNIWLGVTCENQEQADKRIPILLQIPAAKRFVSIEPMLSEVNLRELRPPYSNLVYDSILGRKYNNYQQSDWYADTYGKLDWVLVGSESGPCKRPMDIEWVRHLRNQCVEFEIPFFFKQMYDGNKKITMPELDGRIWNQMPIS